MEIDSGSDGKSTTGLNVEGFSMVAGCAPAFSGTTWPMCLGSLIILFGWFWVWLKSYFGNRALHEKLQMRLVLLRERFFQFKGGTLLIGFRQVEMTGEFFHFFKMDLV
jgi:hypothetical protein